jgi:soluble lytic murein transglycosylase-like protein
MRRANFPSLIVGLAALIGTSGAAEAQVRDERLPPPNPGIGALFSGLRGALTSADSPRPERAARRAQGPVAQPRPRPAGSAGFRTHAPAPSAASAARGRQEELMANAYAPPPPAQASLFGWLARNAAPATGGPETAARSEPARAAEPAPAASRNSETEERPMQAIGRRAPVAPEIEALIADKANKHGVPLPLAHAVVRIESNYNPRAVGGRALGLMQIKHATARGIGFTGSAEQLFDPAVNLEWGMRYLAGARRLARGDLCGTIMRYQSGHRAERMNRANVAYCARVRHLMAHAPRERQQLADRSTRR